MLASYFVEEEARMLFITKLLARFERQVSLEINLTPCLKLILSRDSRDKNKHKRYYDSPFPFLVNMDCYSNTIGEYNSELLSFGLQTREKLDDHSNNSSLVGSHVQLILIENLCGKGNTYLRKQYKRLRHYRETDLPSYWNLSWTLMCKSWSFKLASLYSWKSNWYKTLTPYTIKKLFRTLNRLLSLSEQQTVIRNVWIESPKGKWRQLGVPSKGWRYYLHMLNMFISYVYEPDLPKEHYDGFIFNRGTKSWWEHLLWSDLLTRYPHLLELDISSGFPNIQLSIVRKALLNDSKIPESLVNLLLTYLKSPLQESKIFPTFETYVENTYNQPWRKSDRSLHMGLGLSPILFVITLNWVLNQIKLKSPNLTYKFYADDGTILMNWKGLFELIQLTPNFFFSLLKLENPFLLSLNELPLLKESGIQFCKKKSQFVRINWIWLKPFRSLGLELSTPFTKLEQIMRRLLQQPISEDLSANTRGRGANPITRRASSPGSRKVLKLRNLLNDQILNLSTLKKDYKPYFGLLQAFLYSPFWGKTSMRSTPLGYSQSLLGILKQRLKQKKNRKLELKLNLYNSCSKLTELLLELNTSSYPPPIEWKILYPNIRTLKFPWKKDFPNVLAMEIANPIKVSESNLNTKNFKETYFRKFSELGLTSEQLAREKINYESHRLKQSQSENT